MFFQTCLTTCVFVVDFCNTCLSKFQTWYFQKISLWKVSVNFGVKNDSLHPTRQWPVLKRSVHTCLSKSRTWYFKKISLWKVSVNFGVENDSLHPTGQWPVLKRSVHVSKLSMLEAGSGGPGREEGCRRMHLAIWMYLFWAGDPGPLGHGKIWNSKSWKCWS